MEVLSTDAGRSSFIVSKSVIYKFEWVDDFLKLLSPVFNRDVDAGSMSSTISASSEESVCSEELLGETY